MPESTISIEIVKIGEAMKSSNYIVPILLIIWSLFWCVFSTTSCVAKDNREYDNNIVEQDDDTTAEPDDDSGGMQDDDFIVIDDDYYPPECEENIWPLLLSVVLIVNGEETEMPTTVFTTDELAIAMEYSDQDCNLMGGEILIIPNNDDPNYSALDKIMRHHYKLETIGCSSAQEGEPYILNINPLDYLLPGWLERALPMQFHLFDACYFSSDPFLPLDFTVVEE
jgi:hypothetical protein